MKNKERVLKAIGHGDVDRLPCSYEATFEVTEQLLNYFDLDKRLKGKKSLSGSNQPTTSEKKTSFGMAHEIELQKSLGVSSSIVICPVDPSKTVGNWWGLPLLSRLDDGRIKGAWDIVFQEWEYPYGTYIEIESSPLREAGLDDLKNVEIPSLDLWDFDSYAEVLKEYQGFFVWMNMNGCFDFARFQRGTEEFFTDLALEPIKAEILLDKVNELAVRFFEKCISKVSGLVDGVYLGDDFGTQSGLAISPDMWRKYIKPRYSQLVSIIKGHGLKYCHHSCGSVDKIIPDMIDIGFDVLNPIQPLAKGMDPERLSRSFGKDICFYGGIDEQYTLPNGSVEDVKEEVRHRMETLGRNNGYIVAPSHAFQPDTPVENVLAVYEEVNGNSLMK